MKIKSEDKAMLPEKTNVVHDVIPHYIRAGNCTTVLILTKMKRVLQPYRIIPNLDLLGL